MIYKGQTILASYIKKIENSEEYGEVIEVPGIMLGVNEDEDDECLVYIGSSPDDTLLYVGKIDIRAIGDPSVSGGVYWGKFRTNSIAGVWSDKKVIQNYKDWNKELSNTKRMMTRRKNKKQKE